MRTTILNIENHHIFDDAALSFRSEGDDDNLCFGVQDWPMEEIIEQRKQTKGKFIAMQAELLVDNNARFNNQTYIEKLKQFDLIWDYSLQNIEKLKELGFINIEYHPIVPTEKLKEDSLNKDIDILHFGMMTRHREEYLNHAVGAGYNVTDINTSFGHPVFGDELHQLIRRSHVVLGLHSYPTCPIQESFRYQYPLSNNITVIGEKSISNPLNIEEFSSKKEMVALLSKYITPTRSELSIFSATLVDFESYLEDAKNTTSDDKKWVKTAIDYLQHDCNEAVSLYNDNLMLRVFQGILELYPLATKDSLTRLRDIHNQLPMSHIKALLTEPNTKQRLLLSNWTFFRTYSKIKGVLYGKR